MNKIRIEEIVNATGGKLLYNGKEKYVTGVKHDSRECTSGDMFVAICGSNLDGHDYIEAALQNGCRTFLVSHGGSWENQAVNYDATVIKVSDTVYSMGELAKYYLSTLKIKKVAVTGSVGKTSVRDMIYYVLGSKYKCGRNMKNFNNDIGLPLSIFRFDSSTQIAVLEMGMSNYGEIDRLSEIVQPDIAVITNIGISHIENLGSREGIFKAKMEIVKHIPSRANGGTLIYASGDMLTKRNTAGDYTQITVGPDRNDDYIISAVDDKGIEGIEFTLEHSGNVNDINLPLPGAHNSINSAIAIAVGNIMGIDIEAAVDGLKKTELTGRRLKFLKGKRVNIIDDTYNASPDSVKSALKVLEHSSGSKRIAVLGDMFELGNESRRQHYEVGRFAGSLDIDLVIAIGENAGNMAEGVGNGKVKALAFKEKDDFLQKLDELTEFGDIILVKGSRGMKMEQITEKLLEY